MFRAQDRPNKKEKTTRENLMTKPITVESYRPFLSQRLSPDIRQLLADRDRLLLDVREIASHRFRNSLAISGAERGAAGNAAFVARMGRLGPTRPG